MMQGRAVFRGEDREKIPRLEVLRDISIQVPRGLEATVRFFYASCLGLLEEGAQAVDPSGSVFAFSGQDYRLLVELVDFTIDPGVRRRVVLVVRHLDEVEEALKSNGVAYTSERILAATGRRVLVTDPAGYRLEIRQTWPL